MSSCDNNTWFWQCRCAQKFGCSAPVRSAIGLKRVFGDKCRFLSGGFHPYEMIVSEFYEPIVTTIGSDCFVMDRGEMSAIQFEKSKFDANQNKIITRTSSKSAGLQESCLVAVSEGDDERGTFPALHLFDGSGNVIQRVEIFDNDDVLILAASLSSQKEWEGSLDRFKAEKDTVSDNNNVISILPFLNSRHNFKKMSVEDHLDDILVDGGCQRFRKLYEFDDNFSWEINVRVIPYFLRFLAGLKFVFTRMFVQTSMMQGRTSAIDATNIEGSFYSLYAQGSVSVFDVNAVSRAWIVCYNDGNKTIPVIELYNCENMCVAVFMPEKTPSGYLCEDWDEILYSLPLCE